MNDPDKQCVGKRQKHELRPVGFVGVNALRKKRQIKNDELRVGELQDNTFSEKPQRTGLGRALFFSAGVIDNPEEIRICIKALPAQLEHKDHPRELNDIVGRRRSRKDDAQARR